MINITDEQIDKVRDKLSTAPLEASGYNIIVKPVSARKGMESSEAEQFSSLAKAGFEVKTNKTAEKESHGSDVGVVVSVGPDAYKYGNLKDFEPWVKLGDTVVYQRYTGHRCEYPPGSGNIYHIMNDDDIKAVYKEVTYE